jgi:hypothetical protein
MKTPTIRNPRKTAAERLDEEIAVRDAAVLEFVSKYPENLLDAMFEFRKVAPECNLQFYGDSVRFICSHRDAYDDDFKFPRFILGSGDELRNLVVDLKINFGGSKATLKLSKKKNA